MFALIAAVTVLFSISVAAKPTGKWESLPLQPPPRSKHGQVKISNDIIVIHGGRSPGGETMGDMWTYNITSKQFAEFNLHGYPPAKRSVASVAFITNSRNPNGAVYIWGGLLNDQPTVAYDLFEIDLRTGLSVPVTSRIPGRLRHATVVLGTKMIVAFGVSRGVRNDVWSFDTETYSWTELVPVNTPPAEKYHPCCEPFNVTAILCFGGTRINVSDSNELFMFDTVFRRWEELVPIPASPIPDARVSQSCFFDPHRKTLTISHGWSGANLYGFNDMWMFDVAKLNWTLIPPAQQKLQSEKIDSAVWTAMPNRKAYFFGGWGEVTTINSLWEHDMDTRENVLLFGKYVKPGPRFLHCAVNIGLTMYVLLGAFGNEVYGDLWRYETLEGIWERLPYEGPHIRLFGASCVVRGTMIFIFGGKRSVIEETYSNELYFIDTGTNRIVSSMLPISENALRPTPRFMAAAAVFQGKTIVVFGGKGTADEPYADIWSFHLFLFSWRLVKRHVLPKAESVFPSGIAAPGYRFRHGLVLIRTNSLFMCTGDDGAMSYNDRWMTTPLDAPDPEQTNADEFPLFMKWEELGSTSWEEPMIKSDTVRNSPAVLTGFNATRVFILGGSVDGISVVERSSFHMYDVNTGRSELLTPMPIAVTEAPAVFIGDAVYIFGGRRLALGVVQEPISDMQRFTFDASSLCPTMDDTSGCISCPPGFLPPKCLPCPITTYFDDAIGKCVPCVTGMTNTKIGIIGRIGCTLTQGATYFTNRPTISVQPDPFVPGQTPFFIWTIVISLAATAVATVVFLIFYVGHKQKARRNLWIKPEMHAALQRVFDQIQQTHDVHIEGLGEKELFVVFQILCTDRCRYTVTEEWIADLVQKYDGDGSRLIEMDEFEDMILECCLNPKQDFNVDWQKFGVELEAVPPGMKPLPSEGHPERDEILKSKVVGLGRVNFTLNSIDFFYDGHTVGALGEAMYFKATASGGIATLCWIFGILVILLALSGSYFFENVEETRASQPYLTIPFEITSHVQVTLSLVGSGFDYNAMSSQADVDLACDKLYLSFIDDPDGNIKFKSSEKSCRAGNGEFNVTGIYRVCNLGSTEAHLQLRSSDDRAYAFSITANVQASTGIADSNEIQNDKYQSSSRRTTLAPPGYLVRGLNGFTSFYVDVFPTVYGWKDDIDAGNKDKTSTGYHVYVTDSVAHVVPRTAFLSVNGLNVQLIFLIKGASTLMVSRRLKQDLLTFLSGLVGAISGFVGLCLSVMRFVDMRTLKARIAHQLAAKTEGRKTDALSAKRRGSKMSEEDNIFVLNLDHEEIHCISCAPPWYTQMEKLMLAGLSFKMAKSLIETMTVLNREVVQAVGPRTPVLQPMDDDEGSPFQYMVEQEEVGRMRPDITPPKALPPKNGKKGK